MTIGELMENSFGIIKDDTKVIIETDKGLRITSGNWYQDNILYFMDEEISGFTWNGKKNEVTITLNK